jgi:hypothetical protein
MNVYDSARMADVLAPLGYAPTEVAEEADMVILNTCHIREKATEKVFSDLGRLRETKVARGGQMIVAVAGCVAQAEGAEITARAPWVDIVLGPQSYHRLPEMVARLRQILFLLRGALYARRGIFPPRGGGDCRSEAPGGFGRAGNHFAWAECECLSRRGAGWRGLVTRAAFAGLG